MLHLLPSTTTHLPTTLNNPFYYSPTPVCREAVERVKQWIAKAPISFQQEVEQGKMFGVLVVETQGKIGFLAGYSGQICGRSDWDYFVPAVVDYLQDGGYFKRHEADITLLNQRIAALTKRESYVQSQHDVAALQTEITQHIAAAQAQMQQEKAQRPAVLTPELIRRSQFLKAELHRYKVQSKAALAEKQALVAAHEAEIAALKAKRKDMSDDLQQWLFKQFVLCNHRGERRNLLDIFHPQVPPAGSGECCEPRLLHYAFTHKLRPVSMAMFWMGRSPQGEVRHAQQFYPACNSKCKPILSWMLAGFPMERNPLDSTIAQPIRILHKEKSFAVVCKPAGMLSVPGKQVSQNVLEWAKQYFPNATGPLIVHRLDMATSGLMVVALTMESYHHLQRQFKEHRVKKRYVALLSRSFAAPIEGDISLPLRPDFADRPRQMVDKVDGKTAITHYHYQGHQRIFLYPQTGRTHQLRMHSAHAEGLNNPIVGDALYGTPCQRLLLHAETLQFFHPETGELLTFHAPPDF